MIGSIHTCTASEDAALITRRAVSTRTCERANGVISVRRVRSMMNESERERERDDERRAVAVGVVVLVCIRSTTST
jgi:hypothetical protein